MIRVTKEERALLKIKRMEFAKENRDLLNHIATSGYPYKTPERSLIVARARNEMKYSDRYGSGDIYWSLLNALKEQNLFNPVKLITKMRMTPIEIVKRLEQIDEELKTADADSKIELNIAKGELEACLMADEAEEFRNQIENQHTTTVICDDPGLAAVIENDMQHEAEWEQLEKDVSAYLSEQSKMMKTGDNYTFTDVVGLIMNYWEKKSIEERQKNKL